MRRDARLFRSVPCPVMTIKAGKLNVKKGGRGQVLVDGKVWVYAISGPTCVLNLRSRPGHRARARSPDRRRAGGQAARAGKGPGPTCESPHMFAYSVELNSSARTPMCRLPFRRLRNQRIKRPRAAWYVLAPPFPFYVTNLPIRKRPRRCCTPRRRPRRRKRRARVRRRALRRRHLQKRRPRSLHGRRSLSHKEAYRKTPSLMAIGRGR
jgi:hypothetical protein